MAEMLPKNWKIRKKIWIEIDGKPLVGEGRMEILKAVDQYGTLLEAAKRTKISYRRVRGAIQDMERLLGSRLVNTKRGGRDGGGTETTDLAKKLIGIYQEQQKIIEK